MANRRELGPRDLMRGESAEMCLDDKSKVDKKRPEEKIEHKENAVMKVHTPLISVLVGMALLVVPAWAAETIPANTIEIRKLTCKELMAGNDLERDVMIAYYHGLMDGKSQVEMLDIAQASAISDQIRDYCLSNPTNTVLQAFEQFDK